MEPILAGPYAYGKPMILDLREQKIPAWIRIYCLLNPNTKLLNSAGHGQWSNHVDGNAVDWFLRRQGAVHKFRYMAIVPPPDTDDEVIGFTWGNWYQHPNTSEAVTKRWSHSCTTDLGCRLLKDVE